MDPQILREAMTAYEAVYNEDLREEIDFQNWVNSLVEEGYDLSDYTWEEMYEAYLSEIPINPAAAGAARNRAQAASVRQTLQKGGSINVSGPQGFFGGRDKAGTASLNKSATQSQGRTVLNFNQAKTKGGFRGSQTGAYTPNTTVAGGEKLYKAKLGGKDVYVGARGAKPAAPVAAKPAKPAAPVAAKPSAAPAARPASTAAARPAASAPTAKPASTAAAKPATPAPPAAAKPAPTTTSKPITSQPPESKSQAAAGEIRGMIGRSMERQAASAPVAKPTPTPTRRPMGSVKPGSLVSGFDMFDVVKGYLIDEGFAETEESAIAIMANMSEEWKLEIIDEAVKGESSDRRRALAAERRKGIKPLSAKEGEKYATHKIAQMAYAKRGRTGDDD